MFHMAYLIGSYIAVNYVLKEDAYSAEDGSDKDVLIQLNIAHICTPVFNALSIVANSRGYHVLEKIFDTISIFQYQLLCAYPVSFNSLGHILRKKYMSWTSPYARELQIFDR